MGKVFGMLHTALRAKKRISVMASAGTPPPPPEKRMTENYRAELNLKSKPQTLTKSQFT